MRRRHDIAAHDPCNPARRAARGAVAARLRSSPEPKPAILLLAIVILGLASAPGADAGAWPRGRGKWFVSPGSRVEFGGNRPAVGPTLFLEYGLTDRLTLGVDAWTGTASSDWQATGFVRLPLGRPEAPVRLAFSLGAGLGHATGATQPVLTAGFHAGKGLAKGWLAADLTGTSYLAGNRIDTKLSTTWGLRLKGPWTSVLSADITGADDIQLDQSIVYQWQEGRRLRLGYGQALRGSSPAALTLQTWIEF